jgi:phage gp29-like protein
VKPELGVITSMPGNKEGISFADPEYSKYLMLISSDFRDTGILGKAAKYILFKDNALSNWSEWAEVFGMDKRIGYTNTQGIDRQNFITALRDMGANAYGVFTADDKIEYLGTNRTDAYQVYLELIRYTDAQTSKLVFGQDVVSNETGKLKGTVGENIANMYGDNDARFVAGLVNSRLKPLMENLGFDFQGCYFKWDSTEKLKLVDRADVDLTIRITLIRRTVQMFR